jgi:hypothetical protein
MYRILFIIVFFGSIKGGDYRGDSEYVTKRKSAVKLSERSTFRKILVKKGCRKINNEEYQQVFSGVYQ